MITTTTAAVKIKTKMLLIIAKLYGLLKCVGGKKSGNVKLTILIATYHYPFNLFGFLISKMCPVCSINKEQSISFKNQSLQCYTG